MKYKLEDILDIPLLQKLQDKLNVIYSFPSAIIDNDGKILTAVAWQDICTKFHRANPESERECIKSDKYILEHLQEANPSVSYTCPHGMIDSATPIIIDGKHMGNFFTGQFFLEKPDIDFFKKQAAAFGYNEKEYLDAVAKVPIWTIENATRYLDLIKGFIEIIAGIGLKNLREIEAREELKKVNEELSVSRMTAIQNMNSAIESKQELEIANNKLSEEIEERKRAEEALLKSEKRLTDIMFSMADWVWEVDEKGVYTYSSQKGSDFFGLPAESIVGKTPFDFMPPEESERVALIFNDFIKKKAPIKDLENWNIDKNGNRICLLTNGVPILDEAGNLIGYRGVDKDITGRKKAEEQLLSLNERITLAAKASNIGIWDWDIVNDNLIWDDKMYELYGRSKEAFAGAYEAWIEAIHPEDKDRCNLETERALSGDKDYDTEFRILLPDGTIKYIKANGEIFRNENGVPIRQLGINFDITERKRAEEALLENQSQLAIAVEIARLGPWEYDVASDTYTFNDHFYSIYRTSVGRAGGYTMTSDQYARRFIHPDDQQAAADETKKAIEGGNSSFKRQLEYRIIYGDGEIGYINVRFYIIKDAKGRATKAYGVNQDITERKLAEDTIKRSQQRYNALIETTIDGYWTIDLNGNILEVNDSYCKMTGYTKEQLLKMRVMDVEYFEDEEEIKSRIEMLKNAGWLRFESKHLCSDGSVIDVEVNAAFLKDQNIILAFYTNTTMQKQAEVALKESENRYKMLANNSSDVIWTMDLAGKYTYISPSVEKLRGYTVDEILVQTFEEAISPGSRKVVLNKLQKRISSAFDGTNLGIDILEVEQPCKDGSSVWTEVVTDLLRDELGRAIGIIGISRDITERKKAQDALIENDERYKKAQEVGKVGSWEYNIKNDTFWGSDEGKKIYGFNLTTDIFSTEEVLGCIIERDRVNQALIDLIEKDEPYNIEFEIIPLNLSERRTIHSVAQLVRDENGNPLKVNGVLQDITEQKLIEEERKLIIELLRIMNVTTCKMDLVESVIKFLRQWLKCDAVGIRLKEGDDYPYYETSGFPEKFVISEKYLCSYNLDGDVTRDCSGNPVLDCMCGNIINCRFDISKEFFTQHGSFWSNCTTELLANTTEEDRQARTRNRCNGEGYESVGLFPLRFRGETLGLLQINNKQKGLFTPAIVSFLERIGDNLSIALSNHMSKELLQHSEEKYRKLFSEMMNGFALHEIICDDEDNPVDYVTLDLNPAYESLLNVNSEMVIGKKASDILPAKELKHWLNIFGPVALTGKSTKYEMYSPANQKHFEGIAYSPELKKFAVVFYDITERKMAEMELELHRNHLEELVKLRTDELNKANIYLKREIEKDKEFEMMLQKSLEKEKELNELKSRFISTTSHEFRTPLTALLLSTDLIKRYGNKWSEEKKNEHLDKIRNSVKYLTTLLEDILTLNRAETGEISYKPEMIDLNGFAQDCTEDAKSLLDNNQSIKFTYKSNEKDFYLDAKLMRFILNNLLSNAIKYSPGGGEIKFNISATKKFLKLEVSDEGIGIPVDELDKIFDSFYRSRNAEDMAGTGLGLAIVKRAVELHQGSIHVASELNKGTTFVVKIPKIVK